MVRWESFAAGAGMRGRQVRPHRHVQFGGRTVGENLQRAVETGKVVRTEGGGFKIAPGADLADGRLDVMAFRNMGLVDRLAIMVRLLKGTHQGSPQVDASRASSLRLGFDRPPTYETDGEWNQAKSTDLLIETIPKALEVLAPGDPR